MKVNLERRQWEIQVWFPEDFQLTVISICPYSARNCFANGKVTVTSMFRSCSENDSSWFLAQWKGSNDTRRNEILSWNVTAKTKLSNWGYLHSELFDTIGRVQIILCESSRTYHITQHDFLQKKPHKYPLENWWLKVCCVVEMSAFHYVFFQTKEKKWNKILEIQNGTRNSWHSLFFFSFDPVETCVTYFAHSFCDSVESSQGPPSQGSRWEQRVVTHVKVTHRPHVDRERRVAERWAIFVQNCKKNKNIIIANMWRWHWTFNQKSMRQAIEKPIALSEYKLFEIRYIFVTKTSHAAAFDSIT